MPVSKRRMVLLRSLLWDGVEGDGGARRSGMEGDGPVPHIRGKQDQSSGNGLNRAPDGVLERDFQFRLAELDPAMAGLRVFGFVRHGHVIAGADPALRVQMVHMKTLI